MTQWYYSDGGIQTGPIHEAELANLFRRGQIHDGTLIWQSGMPAWEPLAKHRAALRIGLSQDPFAPPQSPVYEMGLPCVVNGHPVVHAGFLRRWLAIFIDSLILSLPVAVIAIGLGVLLMRDAGTGDQLVESLFSILWLLAAPVYYAGCESSTAQATLGKRAMGIKVVALSGQRLTFMHALGRWFAAALSYLTLYIGFLLAAFTERKQALHDFVAQTLVVDRWAYTDFPERQRTGLHGCAVAALILVPGFFILSIMAAIAIPAYQDYKVRAQTIEVVAATAASKTNVAEFVSVNSRCPLDWEELSPNARPASPLIGNSEVGEFEDHGCGIGLVIASNAHPKLAGKSLYFFLNPETMTWACQSDIERRHLPSSCR